MTENIGPTEALLSSRLINTPAEDLLVDAGHRISVLEGALKRIKDHVCGEKNPKWSDVRSTTITRGHIADICDWALQNITPTDEGRTQHD